ncbi:hypothetical protein M2140_001784 [Clostridiales Family XIII bacterium PM5-7]
MSDNEIITFFSNNSDLFINNSIAGSVIRWIGWMIVKGMTWLGDKCEILYDVAYKMVNFSSWGKINTYVEAMKPLFIALMAVSLFALGIILILNHEKKPKIIINICIAVLCVTCSTFVFQQMNQIAIDLKGGLESVGSAGTGSEGVYDVISENMIDIVYLDQSIGMKNINYKNNEKSLVHPKVTANNFGYIDYTEVLNYKSDFNFNKNGGAEDILASKVIYSSSDGTWSNASVREIYNGFGWNSSGDADLANEFYYRYKFDFFTAILSLAAVIVLYFTLAYKCVRIAFELVVARLFAYLFAAELSGGQKISKTLCFIRDSYILLLTTVLCIRVFYLLNTFILTSIDNTFVQGVFILFAAFCVIDGPNLVEKLLGMDAGLKASTSRLMAAYGGIKAAMHTATAPLKMFGNNHSSTSSKSSDRDRGDSNFDGAKGENGNIAADKMDKMDSDDAAGQSAAGSNHEDVAADRMDSMDSDNGQGKASNNDDIIADRMDSMDDLKGESMDDNAGFSVHDGQGGEGREAFMEDADTSSNPGYDPLVSEKENINIAKERNSEDRGRDFMDGEIGNTERNSSHKPKEPKFKSKFMEQGKKREDE